MEKYVLKNILMSVRVHVWLVKKCQRAQGECEASVSEGDYR